MCAFKILKYALLSIFQVAKMEANIRVVLKMIETVHSIDQVVRVYHDKKISLRTSRHLRYYKCRTIPLPLKNVIKAVNFVGRIITLK